ncbi:MAG TPA: hypothetical protein VNS09_22780 [Solirubrobacter sp.]|nr:hypothetical protein [Solirubrobacter sp.]
MRIGRLLGLVAATTAMHGTPLDALNQLRAANGIPAGIVENTDWSAGCAAHMRYLTLNGFSGDWHTELAGRPGYSAGGLFAARNAVLSNAPSVGLEPDWETTPLHMAQLLGPRLAVTGFAPGCLVTWPGYVRPEPGDLRVYTYPGDGARDVSSPFLYVLGYGGGTSAARLSDVSLTGPAGAVRVRVVDNSSPGMRGYLPPGGYIAPATPLVPGARYSAGATFSSDRGARVVKRWSFVAGEGAGSDASDEDGGGDDGYGEAGSSIGTATPFPAGRTPQVSLGLRSVRGRRAEAVIRARGSAVGRRARVTVQRLGCRCRASRRVVKLSTRGRRIVMRRPVRVTVTVDGFFKGETPFRGLTLSRSLR